MTDDPGRGRSSARTQRELRFDAYIGIAEMSGYQGRRMTEPMHTYRRLAIVAKLNGDCFAP